MSTPRIKRPELKSKAKIRLRDALLTVEDQCYKLCLKAQKTLLNSQEANTLLSYIKFLQSAVKTNKKIEETKEDVSDIL